MAIQNQILKIYKQLTFTPLVERNVAWLDDLIKQFSEIDETDDAGINLCLKFAMGELLTIRLHLRDNREFPELVGLLPFDDACEIVTSFLRTDDEFIQGGYLYVLHEFIFPITKYYYSLIPQATDETFMEFLISRLADDGETRVEQMLQPVLIIQGNLVRREI